MGNRCRDVRFAEGPDAPPGLGFVAANDRAREVHKTAGLRTPYWDWTEREGSEHYRKYAGTAPVHLLFALRQAFNMLFEEGTDNIFLRHRLLAEAVRRAVAVWAEGQVLSFNIEEPAERSNTVTTVRMSEGYDPARLQAYCKEKCGVVLGTGIGDLSGRAFRIAHMGHVNAPMILGTLGVIDVALNALGIPHGSGGTTAAVDWLGQNVPAKRGRKLIQDAPYAGQPSRSAATPRDCGSATGLPAGAHLKVTAVRRIDAAHGMQAEKVLRNTAHSTA